MTKQQARERVYRGDLTFGYLKHCIDCAAGERPESDPSLVNKGITHGQALDILRAALASWDDKDFVLSSRYTEARIARNVLIATNVLWECGEPRTVAAVDPVHGSSHGMTTRDKNSSSLSPPVPAQGPARRFMFITYGWNDPDEAPVLDTSSTLTAARRWMRGRGEGYCYRVERQQDGKYGDEQFVEVING